MASFDGILDPAELAALIRTKKVPDPLTGTANDVLNEFVETLAISLWPAPDPTSTTYVVKSAPAIGASHVRLTTDVGEPRVTRDRRYRGSPGSDASMPPVVKKMSWALFVSSGTRFVAADR